ncbi:UNVERIFIED_CONTAM: hypothetical protein GTU68_008690 [Idotea baltica]|nr:hypothetical protein [Idotea baltica]
MMDQLSKIPLYRLQMFQSLK